MDTPEHNHLNWIDDRWHCASRGIHAGVEMELCVTVARSYGPRASGPCIQNHPVWLSVRIESKNGGRELYAHTNIGDLPFTRKIAYYDHLRWPEGRAGHHISIVKCAIG